MTDPQDDFASMLEASFKVRSLKKGQAVEGTIVSIGAEVAFVDVGGKGEAVLAIDELKDANGFVDMMVGQRIHVVVVSTEGGLTVSRRLARGAVSNAQIQQAYQSRLPVEGKVDKVVKGGYEVRVGGERGFCPLSQIDIVRTDNPDVHIGRTYTFRIREYSEDGRNLVLSRRMLLEEEQQVKAEQVRKTVVPGAVLRGRVVSVPDFGAFVDLGGGVQGLLHVSDMAWSRVGSPSQVVAPGEEVTVQVLRVDDKTQKISLGTKQLTGDPWALVAANYEVGQVREGRVTRLSDFGAFVELEPGVEGLAHMSSFAPTGTPHGWSDQVPVGTTGLFEILTIDAGKRRIGVALVERGTPAAEVAPSRPGQAIVAGARVTGKVERVEKFGVLVFLAPGRTGLMPLSETGVAREGDVAKAFPVGSDVEVIVLEADPLARRIRVSRKAVTAAQEAAEVREYKERAGSPPQGGLGSLGDKLRGALGTRKS